jgi:hypothetical protein
VGERSSEFAGYGAGRQAGSAFAGDHEEIRSGRQPSAAAAKKLAHLSLDSIANH